VTKYLVDCDLMAELSESPEPLAARAAEALRTLKLRYQYLEHDYAETLASREMEQIASIGDASGIDEAKIAKGIT